MIGVEGNMLDKISIYLGGLRFADFQASELKAEFGVATAQRKLRISWGDAEKVISEGLRQGQLEVSPDCEYRYRWVL